MDSTLISKSLVAIQIFKLLIDCHHSVSRDINFLWIPILRLKQNSVGGLKSKFWIRFAARLFGTYSRVASDNIHNQ